MLFSAIIGGRTNFSAANNQLFDSKSKTYCQKTSLYLFPKNREMRVKKCFTLNYQILIQTKVHISINIILLFRQIEAHHNRL
jgi:hypothetical protein